MNLNKDDLQYEIIQAIDQVGLKLAPDALKPLGRIDFAKLVAIHDHEEHFLRTTFISTLITLRRARASTPSDIDTITKNDVKTALLMLGTAAERQAEETLTQQTKSRIKISCGLC